MLTVSAFISVVFIIALCIWVKYIETVLANKTGPLPGIILPCFFVALWILVLFLKVNHDFPYCIIPDVYWNPLNPSFNVFQYSTLTFIVQVVASGLAICSVESVIIYYTERRKIIKQKKI